MGERFSRPQGAAVIGQTPISATDGLTSSVPYLEFRATLKRGKRFGERGLARVAYLLGSRKSRPDRTVVGAEQIARYRNEGCLLVSGLIAPEIVSRAGQAMWRLLGVSPDDPLSWSRVDGKPIFSKDPRLAGCYTPSILSAAASLADASVSTFLRPACLSTVNRFPTAGPWRSYPPHIDHALPQDRHRTNPLPFRIGAMVYLSDVKPSGGGTMVWPGSHRRIRRLTRNAPGQYAHVATLNAVVPTLELGAAVELTPKAGDVLFYHPFCAHAPSENVSRAPRLALNKKW